LNFDGPTRTFSGIPANPDVGVIDIKITADDGISTVTEIFTLTVNNTDDPPVFGGANTGAVTEDLAVAAGNISTSGILTVADPDVGESSFQAGVSNGSYGDLTIDAAGNWSYVAVNSQPAIQALAAGESLVDTLTVTSFDGTTTDVVITINGAEDAPTLDNAVADQTATEDIAFSFTFAANTFGDLDTSDTLIYTATLSDNSALPGWLNFDDSTRTFSGIPANPDVGAIDIKITADDGISTVTDTFTLTVNNTDDPPVFGGVNTGAVTEDLAVVAGNISTSGILTVADPDVGESSFQAGVSNGSYGDLTIDAAGNWSYVADNSQAVIQALAAGESLVDTLTVTSFDGTTTNVVITINGTEDAAVIGGTATAVVVEDGTLVATNSLTISDTDTSDNPVSFNDVASTPGRNGYGNFEIIANTWTYTLNNGLAAVQSLGAGASLSDTFTFTATDGSTQLVTVTINGVAEPQTTPPPAVVDPPVFEPPPEFDLSADDSPAGGEGSAVLGFGLGPAGSDIVRVAQNSTSPSVREEIDVAAYLQQDASETTPTDRDPSKNEQLEKEMEQPLLQAIQQRNLRLDKLTLQVSDDAELNARYEQELLDRIDRMHQGIDSDSNQRNADEVEVQIIMGTTVGLTAGIVSWVLRGGSLLASLMSTVPLLNRFDPLPILKSRDEKEDVEEDKDDERTDTTIRRREKRVDGMFSGTDSARDNLSE
jgi:VCBS repeat-containing protein